MGSSCVGSACGPGRANLRPGLCYCSGLIRLEAPKRDGGHGDRWRGLACNRGGEDDAVIVGVLVMLEPKRSQWWDFLEGMAVIGSAMLGAVVLYLATGLLLAVHLSS